MWKCGIYSKEASLLCHSRTITKLSPACVSAATDKGCCQHLLTGTESADVQWACLTEQTKTRICLTLTYWNDYCRNLTWFSFFQACEGIQHNQLQSGPQLWLCRLHPQSSFGRKNFFFICWLILKKEVTNHRLNLEKKEKHDCVFLISPMMNPLLWVWPAVFWASNTGRASMSQKRSLASRGDDLHIGFL